MRAWTATKRPSAGPSCSMTAVTNTATWRAGSSTSRNAPKRPPRNTARPGTASCAICRSAASNTATASMCAWSPARGPAASWPGSRGCRAGRMRCSRTPSRPSRRTCARPLPRSTWSRISTTPTAPAYACWNTWTSAWPITACRRPWRTSWRRSIGARWWTGARRWRPARWASRPRWPGWPCGMRWRMTTARWWRNWRHRAWALTSRCAAARWRWTWR
ncbi:hypothetical protein LMG1864_06090 [Achromobacter ruhlandii]|nr:hypothetical protein LMG1864_06090 [Achromobacter ruhlandii]